MRISDRSSYVCSSDLPPIVINDGTAPSRWNHLIDRNILQWHEAASAIHLAPDPVESRQDRPPHRVVRPKLKYGKQAWQNAPVLIGPGTKHHLVAAPVQSALRLALLDEDRKSVESGKSVSVRVD